MRYLLFILLPVLASAQPLLMSGKATLPIAPTSASNTLTNGIVGYWRLDETSGTRADSVGSSNLGDSNTVGYATGIVTNAADFEYDNDQYLDCASNAALSCGTNISFTINVWIKIEAFNLAAAQYVVSKSAESGVSREYYIKCPTSTKYATFGTGEGSTTLNFGCTNFGTLSTNTWYMVTGIHDATNHLNSLYINAGSVTSVAAPFDPVATSVRFYIGSVAAGPTTLNFDGLIDEVGLWKRVLTTDELSSLYNSGNGKAYPFQ